MIKNKIKILKSLIYTYIFLLPLQTRFIWQQGFLNGEPWEAATYSLYISDLILLLIFILFIFSFRKLEIQRVNKLKRITSLSILFLLWSGLSIFWADQQLVALFTFIQLIKFSAFIIILISVKVEMKKVLLLIIVSTGLQSLWAILQFYFQGQFASSWLGVSSLNPRTLGVSVIEHLNIRTLRSYGGFSHPNILGGFLGIGFLSSIYLYLKSKQNKYKIISILIFIGLIVSFSRSAWLMVSVEVISMFIIFSFYNKEKLSIYKKRYGYVFLLIILVVGGFVAIRPELFKSRLGIGEIQRLESNSIQERIDVTYQAKDLIVDNWFFGVGIGNYQHAIAAKDSFEQKPWAYQPVHNLYILLIAELGIVGFGLFMLMLANMVMLIWNNIAKNNDSLDFLYSISLFESLLILALFDHYLWTTVFGSMLFALVLANLLMQLICSNSQKGLDKSL